MKLLWIFLFGTLTPLTNAPIHLKTGESSILLEKPISAVTSGASIEIDVSAMVPKAELTLELSRDWVRRNIQVGCLKAHLRGRDTSSILEFRGGSAFAPGKVWLILSDPKGVPVRKQFKSLKMTVCKPLKNVVLYWRNYEL